MTKVPQRHQGVSFSATETRAQAQRETGFLSVGQTVENRLRNILQILRRMGVSKKLAWISINIRCPVRDQVAKVGGKNCVVKFTLTDFETGLTIGENTHAFGNQRVGN